MTDNIPLNLLKRLAKGISTQFGSNCEVGVHDLSDKSLENTVVAIENGSVTNRKIGDGPSHVVLEALRADPKNLQDHLSYLTRTHDGRILKSSTIYIRDDNDKVVGIFAINYDITAMLMAQNTIENLLGTQQDDNDTTKIPTNVNDLLDELIEQSVVVAGKPVPLMTKDDKIKAIKFLNDSGAFLVTKSGDKVSNYFGISKYTLYSYIDATK